MMQTNELILPAVPGKTPPAAQKANRSGLEGAQITPQPIGRELKSDQSSFESVLKGLTLVDETPEPVTGLQGEGEERLISAEDAMSGGLIVAPIEQKSTETLRKPRGGDNAEIEMARRKSMTLPFDPASTVVEDSAPSDAATDPREINAEIEAELNSKADVSGDLARLELAPSGESISTSVEGAIPDEFALPIRPLPGKGNIKDADRLLPAIHEIPSGIHIAAENIVRANNSADLKTVDLPSQAQTESNGAKLREQIVALIALRKDETSIEIALDPPELGKIFVEFEGRGNGLQRAFVGAEASATMELIRRNLENLQAELASAGFGELNIEMRNSGGNQNNSFASSNSDDAFEDAMPTDEKVFFVGQPGDGRLDVRR